MPSSSSRRTMNCALSVSTNSPSSFLDHCSRRGRCSEFGCFLGMKTVVPLMEQSGGGSIVNISSVAGLRGSPGAIAYSATKWALRGMTKAAAIDLAPRKIRVNSVHPGPIDTEMLKVRTLEQNQQRLQLVPMKRMGTADEVASLVPPLR